MKKAFSVMLSLFISLALISSLISCEKEHFHSFERNWSTDQDYHWHACQSELCTEISDKSEHTWDEGTITNQPTYDTQGKKVFSCTVCSATKDEIIEFSGINEEAWISSIQNSNFDNFTFGYNALFLEECYEDVGPHIGTFKLDGDKLNMDGYTTTDPETIQNLKDWYVGSAISIVQNYEVFKYDKNDKTYKATEPISYSVTIMEYDSYITCENVTVWLDNNMNLQKITCKMTQEFEENSTPKKYILDVEFNFQNYNKTIVE